MQILHIHASFGWVFFCGVGTKYDGIQRIVKGYVYLGGYVLNYLLKMIEGMLFTKGTFIWHHIVHKFDFRLAVSKNFASGRVKNLFDQIMVK